MRDKKLPLDQDQPFRPFKPNPEANQFIAWIGITALRLMGWRPGGQLPDTSKFIVIGAPHTSNWELPLALAAMLAFDKRIHWMGKDAIFRPPFGWLFRWMGGVSIDRSKRHNVVKQMADVFHQEDSYIVAITPEGTRSLVEYWKTGFYFMALEAKVPIVLGYFDYARREVGIGPAITPSGDLEADLIIFQQFYEQITAKYPEQFGEIKFRPR